MRARVQPEPDQRLPNVGHEAFRPADVGGGVGGQGQFGEGWLAVEALAPDAV